MLKFGSSILKWYNKTLETYPLMTKCITSGIIAGSGDFCCQYITYPENMNKPTENNSKSLSSDERHHINNTNDKFQLDSKRTFNFAVLGTALVGPILHVWYGLLNKHVNHPSLLLTAIKRTVLDQTICAPLFLPTFMVSLMILEGKSIIYDRDYMVAKLRNDYFDLLLMNWFIWIPAQMLNFRIIPPNYTLLFSNCTGFIWNMYLSYKSTKKVNVSDSSSDNNNNR